MADSDLAVALIYPSLLGTYGDGGNAVVLAQRLRWRGHRATVLPVELSDPIPNEADFYVLGGGEDAAQALAVNLLRRDGGLERAAGAGRQVFAVCAGLQILGHSFLDSTGLPQLGLGLLDCSTDTLPGARAVGELLARIVEPADAPLPPLTGFENHGGRTTLGPGARPLALVESGVGNGDGTEGAVAGSIVATYAHGPALARNPDLADHLLARVVGPLAALVSDDETALRQERLAAVPSRRWPRRAGSRASR